MEPLTTLKLAREVYETTKNIQKVYNVSRQMKTVAESEGKDQIIAAKDLASTTAKIKKEGKSEKEDSSVELISDKDWMGGKCKESLPKGNFVDNLEPTNDKIRLESDVEKFVKKIPVDVASGNLQNSKDLYVDKLSLDKSSINIHELDEEKKDMLQNDSTKETIEQHTPESSNAAESTFKEKLEGLTEQEKNKIKEKTGWSDKIVDAIRTKEEAQIYMDAGLVESEINGKPALLQPRIDGQACNEPKWPDWSNEELAEEGYPPRDKNGRPYELHHIGQNPDSPLAELTYEQHHSDGNFKVLHTFDESSIDRGQFNKERKEYWSERSKTL